MKTGSRHASHYLALVQKNHNDWRLVDSELGQIRRAWEALSPYKDPKLVHEFVEALFPYLQLRGLWHEALVWAERELIAARSDRDKTAELFSLLRVGDAHAQVGHPEKLLENYEQALTLLSFIRVEGDKRQLESVLISRLGMGYLTIGNKKKSIQCYERALKIAQHPKNWRTEFVALINLGQAWRHLGHPKEAQRFERRMFDLARKHQNDNYLAVALMSMGNASIEVGNYSKAREEYHEGLKHARAAGDKSLEANLLHNLASVAQAEGDLKMVSDLHAQRFKYHGAGIG